MADEGCVSPAAGVLGEDAEQPEEAVAEEKKTGGGVMTARVGRPAPDFEAGAFYQNNFVNVKLSDYKGKWIVLCFYPGDFTFV